MSHFLNPSDDDDDDAHVVVNSNNSSPPQQSKAKSAARVKIEIEEDSEDEATAVAKEHDDQLVADAEKEAAQKKEQKSQPTAPTTLPESSAAALHHLRANAGASDAYQFAPIQRPFPMLQPPLGSDKDIAEMIHKWGLAESMSVSMFSYELATGAASAADPASKSAALPGQVHAGMLPELALALLNSDAFRAVFRCGNGHGGHCSLEYPSAAGVSAVTLQQLRCRETTLQMFDKLVDSHPDSLEAKWGGPSIVRDNDAVSHMVDVFLPCGINVSDQLRGLFMLGDESEAYNLYSEEERNEFLFHVMHRIVAGGAVCQYEDMLEPYKTAVRETYKSLISVSKKSSSGDDNKKQLEVQSLVCQVKDVKYKDEKGKLKSVMRSCFFPKDDRTDNHNWMYLVVDPVRRTVCVWYNSFFSPF